MYVCVCVFVWSMNGETHMNSLPPFSTSSAAPLTQIFSYFQISIIFYQFGWSTFCSLRKTSSILTLHSHHFDQLSTLNVPILRTNNIHLARQFSESQFSKARLIFEYLNSTYPPKKMKCPSPIATVPSFQIAWQSILGWLECQICHASVLPILQHAKDLMWGCSVWCFTIA